MQLTLNAPITTKVVCFSRLLKCLRCLYGKQCGPRSDCSYRAVCSGSTLCASILNSSVMIGNYLQQTTSADDIFRCIFFLGALRVKEESKVANGYLVDYQAYSLLQYHFFCMRRLGHSIHCSPPPPTPHPRISGIYVHNENLNTTQALTTNPLNHH